MHIIWYGLDGDIDALKKVTELNLFGTIIIQSNPTLNFPDNLFFVADKYILENIEATKPRDRI